MDESIDTSDTSQLAVFIHGVDSLKSTHGTTTGKEMFEEVSKCGTEMKLPWDELVELTRDVAPAMCGPKSGLVQNCAGDLTVYHANTHL